MEVSRSIGLSSCTFITTGAMFVVPSSEEIKRLVVANGGVYHYYYAVSKVSHIIASNLPTSKISRINDKKIVKPDWIVDRLFSIVITVNCVFMFPCMFYMHSGAYRYLVLPQLLSWEVYLLLKADI